MELETKPESGATYRSTSSRAFEGNRYEPRTSSRQKGSSDIGISTQPVEELIHIATYVMVRYGTHPGDIPIAKQTFRKLA